MYRRGRGLLAATVGSHRAERGSSRLGRQRALGPTARARVARQPTSGDELAHTPAVRVNTAAGRPGLPGASKVVDRFKQRKSARIANRGVPDGGARNAATAAHVRCHVCPVTSSVSSSACQRTLNASHSNTGTVTWRQAQHDADTITRRPAQHNVSTVTRRPTRHNGSRRPNGTAGLTIVLRRVEVSQTAGPSAPALRRSGRTTKSIWHHPLSSRCVSCCAHESAGGGNGQRRRRKCAVSKRGRVDAVRSRTSGRVRSASRDHCVTKKRRTTSVDKTIEETIAKYSVEFQSVTPSRSQQRAKVGAKKRLGSRSGRPHLAEYGSPVLSMVPEPLCYERCGLCGLKETDFAALRRHVWLEHGLLSCRRCYVCFSSRRRLLRHNRLANEPLGGATVAADDCESEPSDGEPADGAVPAAARRCGPELAWCGLTLLLACGLVVWCAVTRQRPARCHTPPGERTQRPTRCLTSPGERTQRPTRCHTPPAERTQRPTRCLTSPDQNIAAARHPTHGGGSDPDRSGCGGGGSDPDRSGCGGGGSDPDRSGCGSGLDTDRSSCGGGSRSVQVTQLEDAQLVMVPTCQEEWNVSMELTSVVVRQSLDMLL